MSGPLGDYVFISYAREDRDRLGDMLFESLGRYGIPYWYDKHIDWDASWWRDDVRPRLKAAHAVVVVMTAASQQSPWVLREVTVAMEAGTPIFPILLDGDGLADLADKQFLLLTDGEEIPADWLDALAGRVRRGRTSRRARKAGPLAAVGLSVVAGLIAIVQFVVPLVSTEVAPLPDFVADYGIGVAEFPVDSALSEREDIDAEVASFQPRLVQGIGATLAAADAALNPDLLATSVEVRLLPRVVTGMNSERDANALRLLAESGADIIVYGEIEIRGASLIARPMLHIASLPRAEELSGRYELPEINQDISEVTGARLLRGRIADLGADLANLALVVQLYDSDRIEEGVAYIEALDPKEGSTHAAVLAIFEGNMRGKLKQPVAAVAAYERALESPAVADRARLGLAQAKFTELLGAGGGWCTEATDVEAMNEVIAEYDDLKASVSHAGANIETKARFGAGRARICLESGGLANPNGEGRRDVQLVIAEYDGQAPSVRDGDLRELAAESEGLIGFVDARSASDEDDQNAALQRLSRAVDLTVFTRRKLVFRHTRVMAYADFGDGPAACREIDEIEKLAAPGLSVDGLREKHSCPPRTL